MLWNSCWEMNWSCVFCSLHSAFGVRFPSSLIHSLVFSHRFLFLFLCVFPSVFASVFPFMFPSVFCYVFHILFPSLFPPISYLLLPLFPTVFPFIFPSLHQYFHCPVKSPSILLSHFEFRRQFILMCFQLALSGDFFFRRRKSWCFCVSETGNILQEVVSPPREKRTVNDSHTKWVT